MAEEAAAAFGLVIEGLEDDGPLEIEPENWKAVSVFVELDRYWRAGDAGRYIDPAGMRWRLELDGMGQDLEIWRQLRILEQEAAAVFGKQAERARENARNHRGR